MPAGANAVRRRSLNMNMLRRIRKACLRLWVPGAGALDASWWKEDFGIPDDSVREVGAMVQPGASAIYALLRTANPELLIAQFRGYAGTILSTTLSPDQQAKVEKVLAKAA